MRHLSRLLAPLGAILFSCGLWACATDPSSSPESELEQESKVEPDVPDTVLLQLRLSTTHTVKFIESSDGSLEVVEQVHADQDAPARRIANLSEGAVSTLADIHRYLLPGASVPAALTEADARSAARPAAPAYEVQPPDEAGGREESFTRAGPLGDAVNWDWTADANWFYQYYYTGGTGGFFAANVTWATQTKKRWTSWYKSSGFNQSFDSYAHFRVDRSKPCGFLGMSLCWNTNLSEWVGNRQVVTYLGTGAKYRKSWLYGSGANPRVGLAVRWVLDGGSQPPPAPSACGGHNQFVCFSGGPRCQPGLVEFNGGCYGCGTRGQACCANWGPVPTPGGWQGSCVQGYCGYPGGYCQ